MRRPSRLCALGASAILFQPLTPYGRGVYRGSEAAVIAARFTIMLDPRSANSLYQEPTWRALLMSNPLPTAPLLADSADLAKREAAKGNKARLAKDNKAAKPSQPAG